RAIGATVHLISIHQQDRPIAPSALPARMENYAPVEEGLLVNKQIYDHEEAEKGIIDYAERNGIGWIGIASNTRKASSSYSIGVTETLIYRTDIPVLSVKVG